MELTQSKIVVYGTPWCGDCRRTRAFLDRHQIVYDWIDIDRDPAARAAVEKINHGNRSVPTIVFPDGHTLTEPTTSQLISAFDIQLSPN